MNVHHLELFYFVARHGGITRAVRNIPYGIQQPAVSGQVAQLEAYLGVTLFQRRPFALTPHGERLYQFIEPFFSNLDTVAAEIHGGKARQIRIGAAAIVLRDHLPELFQNVRKRIPALKIALRDGYPADLEEQLQHDELDLVVTVLHSKPAQGLHSLPLVKLPLALLVPANSRISKAEELWKRDKIEETLICLPDFEAVAKHFQEGLAKLKVDWFPAIEVSSLELVDNYVSLGFGIGVSVFAPGLKHSAGVRALPLPGFSPVVLGALWRGQITPLKQVFLDEFQQRAKQITTA